jgi:superfamily II DNA or RNA helicase
LKLKIVTPIKAIIEQATSEEMVKLEALLKYTNTSAQYMLQKHYKNHWFKQKNFEGWKLRLEELKENVTHVLVFEENGQQYVRPGSIPYLSKHMILQIENIIQYPSPKSRPWDKPLPFQLYPYQTLSAQKLIDIKHGNIELATGTGKSAIILKVCRDTGFRTAVVVPSKSIFNELLEKFQRHLGKGAVGTFGAGKKKIGKQITICIGDSLVNVVPGTEEWDFFSKLDMLVVDESHQWGAQTLEQVCHGVLGLVPYRLFFSGTQIRGDGAQKLLESIIGPTVHYLGTKEAVENGYICPHEFRIIELESSNPNFCANDPLEAKRIHFLRNRNIASFIAKLANIEASKSKRQTLVLVEELDQIATLLPLIKVPVAIAHSESKSERLAELGFDKVDITESVEKFNKSEAMVLIGTSCIATGTNIFANSNTCNWVGGSSLVRTLQGAVGRSVRLHEHNPWKDKCTPKERCIIFDFDVYDNEIMRNHLEQRLEYYALSNSVIKRIRLPR